MFGGVKNASSNVQLDDGSIAAGGRELTPFHGALSLACDRTILFLFAHSMISSPRVQFFLEDAFSASRVQRALSARPVMPLDKPCSYVYGEF